MADIDAEATGLRGVYINRVQYQGGVGGGYSTYLHHGRYRRRSDGLVANTGLYRHFELLPWNQVFELVADDFADVVSFVPMDDSGEGRGVFAVDSNVQSY